MKEQQIQQRWLINISRRPDVRMFRNNVGQGWQGQVVSREMGAVVIQNARPLNAGLCVGSSDLIGWKTVTITPDMVGQQVAVFVAAEVKTAAGRLTGEQTNFLNKVRAAGGLAVVVRDENQEI
jgi:hypothetical protein